MDMLWNREPMKLDENGCNMVRVLYRLEPIKEIFWETRENGIAVIQMRGNQDMNQDLRAVLRRKSRNLKWVVVVG